jgi:hypothetical protein
MDFTTHYSFGVHNDTNITFNRAMIFETLAILVVILLGLTSTLLLVVRSWRVRIIILAAQYLGVFILVALSWPVEMAVAKLVAGWMASAILGMAMLGIPQGDQALAELPFIESRQAGLPSGPVVRPQVFHVFYLLVALLIGLAAISIAPALQTWIPGITIEQALGSLILISMGTVQLAFRYRPFGVIIGLMTVLAGFEIMYSVVESSVLVAGFLAAINLGLAMTGSYLITAPSMESQE